VYGLLLLHTEEIGYRALVCPALAKKGKDYEYRCNNK